MRRLLLALVLIPALAGGLALARAPASDQAALALAQRQAQDAALRSKQLEQAAAKATGEAAKARAEAEALVARIEASEARITAAEAKLRILETRQAEQRARLAQRQQPLIRLASALQTMARRPPALALVQPGSVEDAVRVRALLASALPVIRQRTAALRTEIAAADKLRLEAERAARALAVSRNELQERRTAFARLEDRQRELSDVLAQSALTESDRSIALTEEARDLTGRMNSRAFQAKVQQDLASLPAPLLRPGSGERPSTRTTPYLLPLKGKLVTGFGAISDAGIHSRGLLIEAPADAAIVAPRAGKIVYAGRFRSYGEVVIVDHGGGWSTTITNLAALRVANGNGVKAGELLGRARPNARVGIELRRNGRPQPIAPFITPG